MKLSISLKKIFPALSVERKSGADADILSNALYLYIMALENGEAKDVLCEGINFSVSELTKLLAAENLSYAGNIDLERKYIVKPGHAIEEVVSDDKIEDHLNEIRFHLEKMESLRHPSPSEDLETVSGDVPLEDFDLSLETTDYLEPEDSSEEKIESFDEEVEVGEEAKLEDILDQSPVVEVDEDALDVFGSEDFEDDDEEGFSLDEDFEDDENIIDLHGEQGPFIEEEDISDSGDGDLNDFKMAKLIVNKKTHPDEERVFSKVNAYLKSDED